MKKKLRENDPRIRSTHFAWKEFIITYAILSVLSAGQWMIYAEYMDYTSLPAEYIFGMMGYWAIVSAVFVLVTHSQIRKKFDLPMRKLSKATKEVAEGDFSVYLDPIHTIDQYDYVDVMFEDFNTMVQELGSIETLTNDFITNVSHEIKTPLAIIQNYATAIQKEGLTEEQRGEYSKTIIDASKRLNTLVANILRLNKLDNQDMKMPEELFDVCAQLCDCALQFEDMWERKGIEFIADIEDKAMIRADKEMLEIVWNNLLSNALKFTEAGGEVSLMQTSEKDSITVTVTDTGCGMSRDTIKRIFDKFYQADTSRSSEGNGLGLALASRIVEKMGGTLTVQSELGKGSTFTVIIPVNL